MHPNSPRYQYLYQTQVIAICIRGNFTIWYLTPMPDKDPVYGTPLRPHTSSTRW
ncbi:hypothetical protein L873DRAFT_1798138, partial [Choiromyces venosus 120613-1]